MSSSPAHPSGVFHCQRSGYSFYCAHCTSTWTRPGRPATRITQCTVHSPARGPPALQPPSRSPPATRRHARDLALPPRVQCRSVQCHCRFFSFSDPLLRASRAIVPRPSRFRPRPPWLIIPSTHHDPPPRHWTGPILPLRCRAGNSGQGGHAGQGTGPKGRAEQGSDPKSKRHCLAGKQKPMPGGRGAARTARCRQDGREYRHRAADG